MIDEEIDFTDAKKLREKAEKELSRKQLTEKQFNENNLLKENLLHELQVHQIELEMQNEELRQAYETAENALKKYTMLFDLAPVGYFSLDIEGTICDVNFTGAEMLGERRFSLVNSNFKLFILDDSKLVFNKFFRNVYASNGKESCLVSLGYDNKPLSRVYIEGVVAEEEHRCLLTVVDISNFSDIFK